MATVDPEKLAKLVKRQNTYGDITQSATVGELELLLSLFNNDIPEVKTRHCQMMSNISLVLTWTYPGDAGTVGES